MPQPAAPTSRGTRIVSQPRQLLSMPVNDPETTTVVPVSRRAARNPASRAAEDTLVPPLSSWIIRAGRFDPASGRLEAPVGGETLLLESPPFLVPAGTIVHACLFLEDEFGCGFTLALRSRLGVVAQRSISGSGEMALGLNFTAGRSTTVRYYLYGFRSGPATSTSARISKLSCRTGQSAEATARGESPSTVMPHWNRRQRALHRLCARSRWLNSAVAAFEMLAGKEELVSLPQYMAICPTGQCNASCQFCSVTTNRTGIIKKQLPFEAIDALVSPILGTLRLFGLEGNGEPTLYDRFDDLLFRVTAGGAPVYLITNAERLTREQIGLLLASPVDAVNVSLNAATAPTHREVMKLKGWPQVVENISRLVRWRGTSTSPLVSVSMVVTRQNAHEVQRFLHFCEWELRVDRILIRPLSEIANDSGAVEDLRDLVPYESQINDLFDSIAEYLDLVPRRAHIVIDPAAFRAFASDPPGQLQCPPGFEQFLLAPRREGWSATTPDTVLEWSALSRLAIRSSKEAVAAPDVEVRVVARSMAVPVPADMRRVLRCRLRTGTGAVGVRIIDEADGMVNASAFVCATDDRIDDRLELVVPAGPERTVRIEVVAGPGAFAAVLDLGMTTTPVMPCPTALLPHPTRWQIDTPGTEIRWNGSILSIMGQAPAGRYLYRTYHVSSVASRHIDLAVDVNVSSGALGIGILSGDGARWLATERFNRGAGARSITFDMDDSGGFQVVLYPLTDEPLVATTDWGAQLGPRPRHNDRIFTPDELILPVSREWFCDTAGTNVTWVGKCLTLTAPALPKVYLVRSPAFACPALRGVRSFVRFRAIIRAGRLGVGLLGAASGTFVVHQSFPTGDHAVSMDIDPLGQASLVLVVYSDCDQPLDASIEWESPISASPEDGEQDWRGGTFDPRDGFLAHAARPEPSPGARAVLDQPVVQPGSIEPTSIVGRAWRAYREGGLERVADKTAGAAGRFIMPMGRPYAIVSHVATRLASKALKALLARRQGASSVYCQKPWTDLNNFSVDGRMDVCCITTGPSQERYALGNIFEQDFQEVWNGERMKEFRRTVNTPQKLPPCARCPMANNYSPPF
jgi:radical SAM protein with 4Fe4S-binding SPASM domain